MHHFLSAFVWGLLFLGQASAYPLEERNALEERKVASCPRPPPKSPEQLAARARPDALIPYDFDNDRANSRAMDTVTHRARRQGNYLTNPNEAVAVRESFRRGENMNMAAKLEGQVLIALYTPNNMDILVWPKDQAKMVLRNPKVAISSINQHVQCHSHPDPRHTHLSVLGPEGKDFDNFVDAVGLNLERATGIRGSPNWWPYNTGTIRKKDVRMAMQAGIDRDGSRGIEVWVQEAQKDVARVDMLYT